MKAFCEKYDCINDILPKVILIVGAIVYTAWELGAWTH